jgi:ABC-2 type transport system permease protein
MTLISYDIRPIRFSWLLRAEVRKATSARAARWLLAATVLLTVAGEAIPLVFRHNVAQTRASYLTWSALGLSRLLPIVLLMAMTAEWSQRTAMTTFTLEPHRGRVLLAKVLSGLGIAAVFGCFAFVVATVTVACAGGFAGGFAGNFAGFAGGRVAGGWDWAEVAGFVLFIMLTSAIGIALGAAVHNTAAAIVSYFGLAAVFSLFMVPALERVGDWINTGQTFGWLLAGQWAGHGAEIAVSAALWIVVPLAIGTVRTLRREVRLPPDAKQGGHARVLALRI